MGKPFLSLLLLFDLVLRALCGVFEDDAAGKQLGTDGVCLGVVLRFLGGGTLDRKSTRLNSSHAR